MIDLNIPGRGNFQLRYAVFDVNGTLAVDGLLIDGVVEKIAALRHQLDVRLLTADTHGKQMEIDRVLGFTADRVRPGHEQEQKAEYARALGAEHVVAIGNGANDTEMLRTAAVGIAVIGREGCPGSAGCSRVVVTDIRLLRNSTDLGRDCRLDANPCEPTNSCAPFRQLRAPDFPGNCKTSKSIFDRGWCSCTIAIRCCTTRWSRWGNGVVSWRSVCISRVAGLK
jgi:soluble P-type ATPase